MTSYSKQTIAIKNLLKLHFTGETKGFELEANCLSQTDKQTKLFALNSFKKKMTF